MGCFGAGSHERILKVANRVEFACALPKQAICAEIGVYKGEFSEILLAYTLPKKLHLIDCWQHQISPDGPGDPISQEHLEGMFRALSRCYEEDPRIAITRGVSPEIASEFPDGYFDWIYLDANHSYLSVRRDLIAWYPKIKPGGFFCGHDYVNENYNLQAKKAIDEFIIDKGLTICLLSHARYPDWAFRTHG